MKWIPNALPVLFLITSANATVLFNDTFSDGDRTNAALPSSGGWILAGGGTLSSTVVDGALVSQSSSSTFAIVSAFNGHTLAAGESIILSFSVTLNFNGSASSGSFRMGLFNSGGNFPTGDSSGTNGASPAFTDWDGYSFWSPNGDVTGQSTNIRERTDSDPVLFGTSVNSSRNSAAYTSGAFTNGPTYQGEFRLLNNGSSLTITATLGGASQSWTDTSPSTTTFDSLAFFAGGTPIGADGSFTLDNVMVETIPQPSSILLMAAAPAVLLRRRR
ncbi:hypothetical protein OVA24_17900 [Luteolibacter sp. SL250]|uniref:hypothetical protein n=1 Tax=Luteolibacter sp. SL250 TaxID=2995170 RepID=UPI00226ED02F|nr:hypothetical protein [Luteolibacter sp. SL250]WAC19103.1 hypothetical protein OVA24_17900 [Luteolibacter sp. SL250]